MDPEIQIVATIIVGAVAFVLLVAKIASWSAKRKIPLDAAKSGAGDAEVKEVEKVLEVPNQLKRFYVPSKVKVVVLDEDIQVEDICHFSSDRLIHCPKIRMSFFVPEGYQPTISVRGRKAYITFYFSRDGKALEVKLSEKIDATPKAPNPSMVEAIVNRRLLEQVFKSLRLDWSTMLTGAMLGGFITCIIIFVLLPLMGIPVTVGRNPVEVIIRETPEGVIPPGNYTVGMP